MCWCVQVYDVAVIELVMCVQVHDVAVVELVMGVGVFRYMMWLMECSHDSSRCHACMFFSQVFPFRVMLDLFDQRDGLRRLFNTVSCGWEWVGE